MTDPGEQAHAPRVSPVITDLTHEFWTAGKAGELRMLRCQTCGTWKHPPRPMCDVCRGKDLEYETTSGHGTVYSYVVNHRAWRPGLRVPYVIALVELDDQRNLRLTTNIVGCEPGEVRIGLPVSVTFEQNDDIFVPLFEPRSN